MQKLDKHIRYCFNLTTIVLVLVNLSICLTGVWFSRYLSFPTYFEITNNLSWILLVCSCILLLTLIFSSIHFSFRIIILLMMIPEGLVWMMYPPKQLISSTTFKEETYYLISQKPVFADSPYYQIHKCAKYEIISSCDLTSLYYNSYSDPDFRLIADEVTNEVYVMQPYNQPYFALVDPPRYYEREDDTYTKSFTYELYSYEVAGSKTYIISKCNGYNWETCQTDLHHPIVGYRFIDILGDSTTDNLYMLLGTDGDNIFRAFGNDAHTYEILNSGIFGCCTDSAIWGLVGVQKDRYYEYLLYESQGYLDLAPFHYKTPKKENSRLSYDNTTHLLFVTIGDRLIYTIKEHGLEEPSPLCYVEGCSIPEQ